jgi:hypothetical protein
MVWWHDHLFVGTGRQYACTSLYAIWQFVAGVISLPIANTYLPYPPPGDTTCPADGADLRLQAEIWRRGGNADTWERVFQSPLDLDNPGPEGGAPRIGKKLPYEMSIRGLAPHTERDGTEALYAFGVNTTIMWNRNKLPPPRILRTTDGVNFVPIPQKKGTFLGDLPFNPDHSSFRSPVSYHGKLFVLSGPVFGQGSLIASADPEKGDDAWFLASRPEMTFYETAVFNGWLYLGTFSPFTGGYSVVKTRAEGPPPYQFTTVIPSGAFLLDRPSKSVVSMNEFGGRLYVGTATQTELVRINPDDTWDLVMGPPRAVPLPGGGVETKYPLSGLDAGFGQTLNDHAWQMVEADRFLYIGTYNAATASMRDPVNGPKLAHSMGANLFRTGDGWYYSAVTTDGFASPSDPQGGKFDYGIRSMATTPHGTFVATVNDAYGLSVFRATPRWSNAPDPPERVEVDVTKNGSALLSWQPIPLSWQPIPRADKYQIWRAEVNRILVRDDINFENWNGTVLLSELFLGVDPLTGNKIPDTYVGPYALIGSTSKPFFIDATVQPGKKYMYYVLNQQRGGPSDQSNLVAFPLLGPAMTFAQLNHEIDRWVSRGRVVGKLAGLSNRWEFDWLDIRHRFVDRLARQQQLRALVDAARTAASRCQISDAIKSLELVRPSQYIVEPEATDFEILIAKLVRRLALFRQLPGDVMSDEFCRP